VYSLEKIGKNHYIPMALKEQDMERAHN